ncbi:MAG: AbrB/MazE/SpoVT family DNA-binding domain-containing protein [Methanospirillum sp.]|nr:AbrB/MazE/SpoVT family DNA-binding domain-containing protein [Methanospirillum sp.]
MVRTDEPCCSAPGPAGRCSLEAIVTIDERGQLLLPKDLRVRAGISPGSKLAVIGWETGGETCCLMLVRADRLDDPVKSVVGPLVKDALLDEVST